MRRSPATRRDQQHQQAKQHQRDKSPGPDLSSRRRLCDAKGVDEDTDDQVQRIHDPFESGNSRRMQISGSVARQAASARLCQPSNTCVRICLRRPEWSHILKRQEFKGDSTMSTATVTPTPEVVTGTPKSQPVNLTPAAIAKVKE